MLIRTRSCLVTASRDICVELLELEVICENDESGEQVMDVHVDRGGCAGLFMSSRSAAAGTILKLVRRSSAAFLATTSIRPRHFSSARQKNVEVELEFVYCHAHGQHYSSAQSMIYVISMLTKGTVATWC